MKYKIGDIISTDGKKFKDSLWVILDYGGKEEYSVPYYLCCPINNKAKYIFKHDSAFIEENKQKLYIIFEGSDELSKSWGLDQSCLDQSWNPWVWNKI